jgi:hypothetical protein
MSAGIQHLHQRIDSLSADILRQTRKEVLRDLERSKSAAQRELNAFRDPIGRLPLELSSHIFLQCLPSHRQQPGARHVPMLFLNICNTWTDIALSAPQLWAGIHIDAPVPDLVALMDVWLKRASGRALSVSLPTRLPDDIAPIIARHAPHLQNLKMFHSEDDLAFLTAAGPFPILRNLTIVGLFDAEENRDQHTSSILDMLRVCPNLVECTFDCVFPAHNDIEAELVVLPCLQHLKFGIYPSCSNDEILRSLSLPQLQTLYFPQYDAKFVDILRFLRRSSPPLQKITLGCRGSKVQCGRDGINELLSLLPNLTHLKIYATTFVADHLIATLANSPYYAPHLRSLQFLWSYPDPAETWYQNLVKVLLGRRNQITFVRVASNEAPSPDILTALRQFVADGMTIRVERGKDQNFI